MKILQLHAGYRTPAGEDTVVAAEAAVLADGGHDVHQHIAHNPPGSVDAIRVLSRSLRNRNQEVLIRSDKRSQFGLFAQAFDACRVAKLQRIDIAAAPSEGN